MMERRIPESIKEKLRKRLLESMGDRNSEIKERIRGRLRRWRLLESKIRERLQESGGGLRRWRLLEGRRRMLEGGVGVRKMLRDRLRRRLLEGRGSGDVRSILREKIRKRLLEKRGLGMRFVVRGRLLEGRAKSMIRERLRRGRLLESRESLRHRLIRKWLNSDSKIKRLVVEGKVSESGVSMRGRMLEGMGCSGDLRERRLTMLERRHRILERELKRKTRLLKEAYKVVKRVDEMGGIQKIERALKLAHDTIVKAGTKLFKEAVEVLSAETGVDKKRVAELVKKVGLKEAREILKRKGGKVGNAPKTIVVEGVGGKKEQLPVLAIRIAERLSKAVEAGNPGDMKQLGEAVFKKVGE